MKSSSGSTCPFRSPLLPSSEAIHPRPKRCPACASAYRVCPADPLRNPFRRPGLQRTIQFAEANQSAITDANGGLRITCCTPELVELRAPFLVKSQRRVELSREKNTLSYRFDHFGHTGETKNGKIWECPSIPNGRFAATLQCWRSAAYRPNF